MLRLTKDIVVISALISSFAQGALAQDKDDKKKSAAEEKKADEKMADEPATGVLQEAEVPTKDYASESQTPEPPGKDEMQKLEDIDTTVATHAGVGSPLAYGHATVAEVGGSLALTHASDTTTFRITPVIGYFVLDNIELSVLPDFGVIDVDGNTDVVLGLLAEPSYHLPMTDSIYGFIGLGIGLTYGSDPGVDFALRPRLGMDILVGRSGILKPALFLDFGAADGVSRGGVEAAFTVML